MQKEERKLVSLRQIVENTKPQSLLLVDPLGRLLFKLSPKSSWPVAAIALALHVLVNVVGGSIISAIYSPIYSRLGKPFLSISDPRSLPFVVLVTFVFIPLVWLFYAWVVFLDH